MTSQPQWESVDNETATLLDLVSDEGHPSADFEYEEYVRAVRHVADADGRVDPNALREMVRGVVAPRRIGAFTHRARTSGLLVWTGEWVTSTDTQGRNAGRPIRAYRLGDER
jgi:hypothetical protein